MGLLGCGTHSIEIRERGGSPASIITENWRVKMARFLAFTFLLLRAAFTGAPAFEACVDEAIVTRALQG